MYRTMTSLLACLCALILLASCAQTSEIPDAPVRAPEPPPTNLVIKYHLRNLEMDILKSTDRVGQNIKPDDEMRAFFKDYFLFTMKKKGLLAEATDVNVVDLDIFVDYRHRFMGDGTPLPANILVSPNAWFQERRYLGNELLRETSSPVYNDVTGVPGGLPEDNPRRQLGYAAAIANTLIKRLEESRQLDANVFAAKVQGLDDATIIAHRAWTPAQRSDLNLPKGISGPNYIPAAIAQSYLDKLHGADMDERIDALDELTKVWLNSDELYSEIEKRVKAGYQSTDDDVVEEIDRATRALAFSGLAQYQSTVALVAKKGSTEELRRSAEEYLPVMEMRIPLASAIHDTHTMDPGLDWRQNQLSNMLRSGNAELRILAVKEIYRDHGRNAYLLDQLSVILDKESRVDRFRYGSQSDFYAWICRVLGSSENAKYKPLLESLAQDSPYKKVRKFAEEYADELG